MILNLTEYDYPGEEVVAPAPEDARLLYEVLADESRLEEAVLLIEGYSPAALIVDISDEYFVKLRVALEDTELVLGVDYERT